MRKTATAFKYMQNKIQIPCIDLTIKRLKRIGCYCKSIKWFKIPTLFFIHNKIRWNVPEVCREWPEYDGESKQFTIRLFSGIIVYGVIIVKVSFYPGAQILMDET